MMCCGCVVDVVLLLWCTVVVCGGVLCCGVLWLLWCVMVVVVAGWLWCCMVRMV